MSRTLNTMKTLLELALIELDAAAKRLAKANQQAMDAKIQQEQLASYRDEYLSRNQLMMSSGMGVSELINTRNFIKNLDLAVNGQNQIIENYANIAKNCLAIWQSCQSKKRSYEILLEREMAKLHRLELKKEQKMMDEFSSNQKRFLLG